MCEICKCRVATSLYLEGRGEGVSVEEGETPLDPPLLSGCEIMLMQFMLVTGL